ncbi:MAG: hypothetical protein PUE25_02890 [bacterium]|nr:hypothetical protein [bacterium]
MKYLKQIILVLAMIISCAVATYAQNFQTRDIITPEVIEGKVKANSNPDELGFYQVEFFNTPAKLYVNHNGITSEVVMKYNNDTEYSLSAGKKIVKELTEKIAKLFPKSNDIRIAYDVPTFGSCIGNSVTSPYEPIIVSIFHDFSTTTWKGNVWIRIVY